MGAKQTKCQVPHFQARTEFLKNIRVHTSLVASGRIYGRKLDKFSKIATGEIYLTSHHPLEKINPEMIYLTEDQVMDSPIGYGNIILEMFEEQYSLGYGRIFLQDGVLVVSLDSSKRFDPDKYELGAGTVSLSMIDTVEKLQEVY